MWRPQGWRDDFKDNPFVTYIAPELAYELGANDMLIALEPLIRQIAPASRLVDILYKKEEK